MFFLDHCNILFKSAAINHLRTERICKLSDGECQLTIKFSSYSELKRYQKRLRMRTVSVSSMATLAAIAFLVGHYS